MVRQRLEFVIEPVGIPSDEDLQELIEIAKNKPDDSIIMNWYVAYSGWYSIGILPFDTVESCYEKMPKMYPV